MVQLRRRAAIISANWYGEYVECLHEGLAWLNFFWDERAAAPPLGEFRHRLFRLEDQLLAGSNQRFFPSEFGFVLIGGQLMSVWFPFGFEQSRAAHDAAIRLRRAFPALNIRLHESRIEISAIPPQDEALVLNAAAETLISCRDGRAEAA